MSKNQRINEKKLAESTYFAFYDFLMFDPLYKGINPNAKILYCYLRNKVSLFEGYQQDFEQGQSTKSYKDDDGNLFLLADNSELQILMNCAESTLIRLKKELIKNNLLEDIRVKNGANRLYLLEPSEVATKTETFESIKQLREVKKVVNKEKHEKFIAKSSNLQNESYGNLQNESKSISNIINLNLIPKLITNLSILEKAYKKYVVDFGLIDDLQFKSILISLENARNIKKVDNFEAYVETAMKNYVKDLNPNKKPIRQEINPSWNQKTNVVEKKDENQMRQKAQKDIEILMAYQQANKETGITFGEFMKKYEGLKAVHS